MHHSDGCELEGLEGLDGLDLVWLVFETQWVSSGSGNLGQPRV